ncbi:hypothetical protein FRC12_013959 [Ceratobasidium sp. 428]|nr:hypothetical protein FRC12_013959 [Ceratobasidium sp. 428]
MIFKCDSSGTRCASTIATAIVSACSTHNYQNDIAIWDNRSVYHTATFDYEKVLRVGDRVVSLGEKPYFDPKSKSRREFFGTQIAFNLGEDTVRQ